MNERNNRRQREKKEESFLDFFSDAGNFDEEESFERRRAKKDEARQRKARGDNRRSAKSRQRDSSRADRGYEGYGSADSRRRGRDPHEEHHGGRSAAVVVVLVILAVLLVGGGLTGMKLYERYSYSRETMALRDYFKVLSDEDVPVLIGNELSEVRAFAGGGNLYLPLDFVQKNLNSRFFYDKKEGLILYTTPTKIYSFAPDSSAYTIDGESMSAEAPVWVYRGDMPCLEIGFLSGYSNFIWERYEDPLRLQLYLANDTIRQASITKDTQLRYQGGVKSDVLTQLKSGDAVTVIEEMEEWSKVKSPDAVIGYVENKRLSGITETSVTIPSDFAFEPYTSLTRDHKINMAWHQVTNAVANDTIYDLLANSKAVNVVSPTWYFLSDNAGGFTTIADASYVSAMHDKGIEVWALIDNFTNQVDIAQILSSFTNRQNLIRELTASVLSVGADGINVDFELVPKEAGADYTQFVRELSIACRLNGLVLSIDNYVPTDYSDFYNRGEQGIVADYVVIMGYDEHYAGSDEAGSVASRTYVQDGIENTIAQVPSRKVINGIPFYTRLWRTGSDGVTSEALTMPVAKQALEKREITPEWDDTTSQYYASFEEEGKTCQIWMEEADSLRAKLKVMAQYDLGGVAEWKLGQELPEAWEPIEAYMNGTLGD